MTGAPLLRLAYTTKLRAALMDARQRNVTAPDPSAKVLPIGTIRNAPKPVTIVEIPMAKEAEPIRFIALCSLLPASGLLKRPILDFLRQ